MEETEAEAIAQEDGKTTTSTTTTTWKLLNSSNLIIEENDSLNTNFTQLSNPSNSSSIGNNSTAAKRKRRVLPDVDLMSISGSAFSVPKQRHNASSSSNVLVGYLNQ